MLVDMPSAVLSAAGMFALVYGLLQSKVWGWVTPMSKPVIAGHEIAPLGISLVAYLILLGIILLKMFYDRSADLERAHRQPLVSVTLFKIKRLRSGLAVLGSQYVITAAVFFVVPIFLQMMLGYDALQTGKKIFPLSVSLILFSLAGTRLVQKYSPRQVVRLGQILLIVGSVALLSSIRPDLEGFAFAFAMFMVGAGLGLLASQLGNVNMGAVDDSKTSEVGGLQGSFQNLGSSLGTALIGSVLIASLTSGFVTNINNTDLDPAIKTAINESATKGVQIVPVSQVESIAQSKGLSETESKQVADEYANAQLAGLRESVFFLIAISIFSLVLSRGIPKSAEAQAE